MIIEECFEDRRSERSSFTSQALHLQLKQVSDSFDLDAMVLSDDKGNLWSSSHFSNDNLGLALSLAGMGELSAPDGFCQIQGPTRPVMFKMFQVQQATLYLCAQGDHADFRPALAHAADGVERILSELS
jgi:hypothetical protein